MNQFADWDRLALIKKPIIGAVKGFVFGGGFELSAVLRFLNCSQWYRVFIPRSELGVMPGAGGTQRLTKLAGRTKALEWLWTGERISAETALNMESLTKL